MLLTLCGFGQSAKFEQKSGRPSVPPLGVAVSVAAPADDTSKKNNSTANSPVISFMAARVGFKLVEHTPMKVSAKYIDGYSFLYRSLRHSPRNARRFPGL